MAYENYQPVIEVTRGKIVESVHFGAAAVVDMNGKLIASVGDPKTVTYLRSSAKPFQALTFTELGGQEHFGLTDEELALLNASHSGTDRHVEVVLSIQKKIGVKEEDLQCGTHYPIDEATSNGMRQRGEIPTSNRHNCSGKHTGMLAQAILRNLPYDDYLNPQHPVQQANLKAFCEMCDIAQEKVELGTDGCSAPVFAVPLYNAALGYARFCDPHELQPQRAAACRHIFHAMTTYPFMVAGPNRFDLKLMEAAGGKIFTKAGAEGYQGLGLLPGVLGHDSPGVGIVLKVSDGDLTGRAIPTFAVEILRQLGVLTADQLAALSAFDRRPVYNWRKLVVGELRTCFKLNRY
jgi:L-asparaginase II